jgi:filamentous hemagglutinin family protein
MSIVMGIVNKILGEKKTGDIEGYVDLEKYVESTGDITTPAKMHVRVGEIQRYEDLKEFTDYVYGGNVLILDFSPIAEEEVILKRITNDLKKLAGEIDGDIAGIGNNMMIIAPSGVKIDRRKLRGKYA